MKNKKIIIFIIVAVIILIYALIKIIDIKNVPESYYIEGKSNYITEKGWSEKSGYQKSFIELIEDKETFLGYFGNYPEIMKLLNKVVDDEFFNKKSLIVMQATGMSGTISELKIKNNKAIITFKEDYNKNYFTTFFIPVNSKNLSRVEWIRDYPLSEDINNMVPTFLFILPILIMIVSNIMYKKKINHVDENKLSKLKTKKLYINIACIMYIVLYIIIAFAKL